MAKAFRCGPRDRRNTRKIKSFPADVLESKCFRALCFHAGALALFSEPNLDE